MIALNRPTLALASVAQTIVLRRHNPPVGPRADRQLQKRCVKLVNRDNSSTGLRRPKDDFDSVSAYTNERIASIFRISDPAEQSSLRKTDLRIERLTHVIPLRRNTRRNDQRDRQHDTDLSDSRDDAPSKHPIVPHFERRHCVRLRWSSDPRSTMKPVDHESH